jgi:glycosyltransferase involved in cell wall biosynthesis
MDEKQQLPMVSIVITNHNYARWVGEAMRSVDEQDYPNKTLIVIDDGSTDNSWDVIRLNAGIKGPALLGKKNVAQTGMVGKTRVIAYRFDTAGGPSRGRNLGIKLGWKFSHIYCFLDADDVYLPGKISKSVAKIIEDPQNIGGVYSDYNTINWETGVEIREYKEPFSRERLLYECMIHSACVVSKPALERVFDQSKQQFYDEDLRTCEDYDLWLRITEHFVISHIPEALMRVRTGSHNATATVAKDVWERNWKRVAEKTQARMRGR